MILKGVIYLERSEEIALNIEKWKKLLPNVDICAVTKTMPVSDINIAIDCGIRYIGENRVQELMTKLPEIKSGASIQLIGQLQTNKVKYLIGNTDCIQSVDRLSLAREISLRSVKNGVITSCLIEVSMAGEEQKGGVPKDELFPLLEEISQLDGIKVNGLMTVMPAVEDAKTLAPLFKETRMLFEEVGRAKIQNTDMNVLSMGMSNDCLIAAENGATMVRIGRGIFGARNYNI